MAEESNKYIYRKVAIENSYIVEDLPDGSKKIVFQPIIYISCRNQKDLTIIDFDLTESITDNVSALGVNNINNNNHTDSLVPVEPNSMNNGINIVSENLPGIIKDINQRNLIKSDIGTANDLESLKVQTPNQDVLEPIIEITETNFDNPTLDSRQTRSRKNLSKSMNAYCSKCQEVLKNISNDNCSKCQYPLLFQCIKCFQSFKSHVMVANHVGQCEVKIKSFMGNVSCKPLKSQNNATMKLLGRNIEQCSAVKNQRKSFECKQCKGLFQNNRSLSRHQVVCGKQGQCPHCPFSNTKKGILSYHISKKHQEYMPDDFKCLQCGKKYNQFSSLKTHIRKSKCNKKTLYTCNHCNLQTYNKTTLANHLKKNHVYSLKQRVSAKLKI